MEIATNLTGLSDLTEADNILANAKKMLNEAREERQIAELKSQKKGKNQLQIVIKKSNIFYKF